MGALDHLDSSGTVFQIDCYCHFLLREVELDKLTVIADGVNKLLLAQHKHYTVLMDFQFLDLGLFIDVPNSKV